MKHTNETRGILIHIWYAILSILLFRGVVTSRARRLLDRFVCREFLAPKKCRRNAAKKNPGVQHWIRHDQPPLAPFQATSSGLGK